eukprot:Plantae.Rhodophyta-Hildenbrandia_rubra.ctg7468.p1 GENE.Plantae.Rhodophyta-Hildenbrandia_rubra.ctg7468~~Plantae.Rhodophyta-Hildenbrandia_rubra.ctg7468.p1  ORF type:complete len:246 (-),score=33.68 Plantae.Rhodophyta-Hildenbrandia_rubra.ctg7468:1157-1894(-)
MGRAIPIPPGHHCVHCGATETPLWRTGPDGPRSLCNRCGVRKSKGKMQLYRNIEGRVTCIKSPGAVPINNPLPVSPRKRRDHKSRKKVNRKVTSTSSFDQSSEESSSSKSTHTQPEEKSSLHENTNASPISVAMADKLYQDLEERGWGAGFGNSNLHEDWLNLDPLVLTCSMEDALSSVCAENGEKEFQRGLLIDVEQGETECESDGGKTKMPLDDSFFERQEPARESYGYWWQGNNESSEGLRW